MDRNEHLANTIEDFKFSPNLISKINVSRRNELANKDL